MSSTESGSLGEALGNQYYQGRAFGWIFLVFIGCINLFRGSVHTFKSDGGAASIAGIDLSMNGEVILSLFAAAGIGQLLMAAIDFATAIRFRRLVPLVTGYHLLQAIAGSWVLWVWRPLPLDAPGKFGILFLMVPLSAIAVWAATRRAQE